MSADFNKEIYQIISHVLKCEFSVSVVILGDRTGLTIARVSRLMVQETMGEYDLESIGAIASAVFCGAAEQGNSLQLGELDLMVAEFTEGKILTASCGNGILIVVTDREAQLGLIRVEMKKASEKLSTIMHQMGSASEAGAPKKGEAGEDQSIMSALKELENF